MSDGVTEEAEERRGMTLCVAGGAKGEAVGAFGGLLECYHVHKRGLG